MRNKMLHSSVILLLFVAAARANPSYGWENGKQYTYNVQSRTLATFNLQSKQYAGVVIEGRLIIQRSDQNTLRAGILHPKYSQIHTRLENDWDSVIPQSQLNMQNFPMSGEPFEIKTKNGIVEDLIVNREVPTWEVNVIKSIVSQLQLDTLGQNAEQSQQNQLPEDSHPYAMFKVMEDTITGRCEVMYDISPLPEHLNKRKIVPMPELRENGEIISIIKTKNYSSCDQRIAYNFGIDESDEWEPGSNENGNYLFRSSVSRVIISGNLEKYTIQSSVTTNKVVQNFDQQENEQGIVVSRVNLTLHEIKDVTEQVPPISNPQSTGSLVYTYNNPAGDPSSRRSSKFDKYQRRHQKNSTDSEENMNEYSDISYNTDENSYLLPKPTLIKAPLNPLLSYFVGYHGNSIQKNNKVHAVRKAKNLAQQIGNDIQKPDSMSEEETLDKFAILCKLIRTMSAEQIAEVHRSLYWSAQSQNQLQQNSDNSRRDAWIAFRDAVANAGTGPALVNVKQWIQNNQIEDNELAKVIDNVARTARTPTSEYVDTFYEIVTMPEVKKTSEESAILTFANFLRYAVIDKRSVHNRYPVHSYGKLISRDNRNVEDKYIPYLAEELKAAVNKGDSQKVLLYTLAIGKTGHPRVLAVFEPYLEGKKPISLYQRLTMVFSLRSLIATHPKVARSVLYKIYSNSADHHEIRTAAIILLAITDPPASMLQRMAEYTNYDSNNHVNSAVKSLIQSFAELDKGKAALALLKSENYGLQYSRMSSVDFESPITKSRSTLEASYIGSSDSVIPKAVYSSYSSTFKGLKMPEFAFSMSTSSVPNIFDFIMQKLNQHEELNDKKSQQKYSPENIAKYLNINGDGPDQIEGVAFLNGFYRNHLMTFDNHTLEKIYQKISQTSENLRNGKNYEENILNNYEIAISFPTESGFPYHFSLKMPTIVLFKSYAKFETNKSSDSQSSLPDYASVSGKARIVYNAAIQKRVGFVTPFEHQEYIVGIDRNLQVHLPIRSEVEYNNSKKYLKLKIQPNEDEGDFKVLQYSTQPFTAKHDILSLQPIKKDENTYIIHKNKAKSSQIEYFDPQSNNQILQFNWENVVAQGHIKNKLQNAISSFNKLVNSASYMFYPKNDDAEYQKYSVQLSPPRDLGIEVRLSYDSQTPNNAENNFGNSESKSQGKAPHLEKNLNEQERKQKLLKEASKHINSAQAKAIDISVRLNKLGTSVDVTAAIASSNIDKKSRALLHVYANILEELDYHLAAGVESKIPNIKSFDYEKTLEANVPREYDAEIHFGIGTSENSREDHNRIRINGKVQLTEDRKNQIRQSRTAQECSKQVNQNGNKLSLSCQKVNSRAAFINSGDFTISLNKETALDRVAMEALDIVEFLTEGHAEVEKDNEDREESKKIKVSFTTSSNDDEVNLSVKTPKGRTEFKNIKINFDDENVKSTEGEEYENDIEQLFKSTCSLDKSYVRSFDNHHFNLRLDQCWYVAVTSYPKNNPDNPTQHLPIPENMNLAILVKENENDQKDLKITLGDKEIELSAPGRRQIQAKVNGENAYYSKEESQQERKEGEIVYEFFELPDKSVKLVSSKFDIELVYDGERTEIKVGNRYRDSVLGLCGNNDGEWENDQQTPDGYLLRKSEEFSASFALINDNQCLGSVRQYAEKAKMAERIYQNARPGNVISDKEASRSPHNEDQENHCTTMRTKVLKSDNEICFSTRPVTTCLPNCKPSAMKSKSIQYHCVPRNTTSEKVAQQVENGSNPDLSQEAVSKTEDQQIASSCKA